MKKLVLTSCLALGLVACGAEHQGSMDGVPPSTSAKMAPMVTQSYDMAEMALEAAPPAPTPGNDATSPSGPMLAYTHNRSIEAPAQNLSSVVESHRLKCVQAGPQVCMVVNASQNGVGEDWGHANLHIKAAPFWVDGFLGTLESDLDGTKARITASSTYAEDLSTQIIDTDARLKAKITLRDRLQALLSDRPSELGDLINLERELARVQADIDSAASVLAALKQRVEMSNVHMNYSALQPPQSHSVWRPLGDAITGFAGNFAWALGGIITALAVLLPWIPVGIGLIWLARVIWRRVFRKKDQPSSET